MNGLHYSKYKIIKQHADFSSTLIAQYVNASNILIVTMELRQFEC